MHIANSTKPKRSPKTLPGQIEIYVEKIATCNQLRTGAGDPEQYKELWNDLAAELNAFGKGPKKSASEWDSTFKNWKYSVRHKARQIAVHDHGELFVFNVVLFSVVL